MTSLPVLSTYPYLSSFLTQARPSEKIPASSYSKGTMIFPELSTKPILGLDLAKAKGASGKIKKKEGKNKKRWRYRFISTDSSFWADQYRPVRRGNLRRLWR